jgi:hypothetical protein
MKQFQSFFFILGSISFLLCNSCRKKEEICEISRHYDQLTYVLSACDTAALYREHRYVVDTLLPGVLFASDQATDYLRLWASSYLSDVVRSKTVGAEITDTLAIKRFCIDVKRLAARILNTHESSHLEAMLRPVASMLQERRMTTAAMVTAAAAVGVDVDPAYPGDIAHRLLTRLLLVGMRAPDLTNISPSAEAHTTLLLFYETDCPNCDAVLRDLCKFYPTLESRGIHVISIAADEDEDCFASRAASLPWVTKWHDPRGFYSPDFAVYGIAFTPTIAVINQYGQVVGFYNTPEETGLLRTPNASSTTGTP